MSWVEQLKLQTRMWGVAIRPRWSHPGPAPASPRLARPPAAAQSTPSPAPVCAPRRNITPAGAGAPSPLCAPRVAPARAPAVGSAPASGLTRSVPAPMLPLYETARTSGQLPVVSHAGRLPDRPVSSLSARFL